MSKTYKMMQAEVELRAAIDQIAARHGLTASITNSKDDVVEFGFWTKFTIADTAQKEDLQRREFAFNCSCRVTQYQVKPEDYGMILTCKGKRYKLVGVNRDADKYPLVTEALDGGPDYRLPMQMFRKAKGTLNEMEKLVYS
jgi:hypothetical protein